MGTTANVLNLPYASTQEVLRQNRLESDLLKSGRKHFGGGSTMAAASMAASATQDAQSGGSEAGVTHNDRSRGDTIDSTLFESNTVPSAKQPDGVVRSDSMASAVSVAWAGWQVGMRCKAEFPDDGG